MGKREDDNKDRLVMIQNHSPEAGKLIDHTTKSETSVSPASLCFFPEQEAGAVARASRASETPQKHRGPQPKAEVQANTKEDGSNCMVTGSSFWYPSRVAVTSFSGAKTGEDDRSPCFMLIREISSDVFPGQCHEMSACREGGGAKSEQRGTSSHWQVGQASACVTD